jgi:hypothetical protein
VKNILSCFTYRLEAIVVGIGVHCGRLCQRQLLAVQPNERERGAVDLYSNMLLPIEPAEIAAGLTASTLGLM